MKYRVPCLNLKAMPRWVALLCLPLLFAACSRNSSEDDALDNAVADAYLSPEEVTQEAGNLDMQRFGQRWRVQARPVGQSVFQSFPDRLQFAADIRVVDEEGRLIRGLQRAAFDFSVDGIFGRGNLVGLDEYRVFPEYHGGRKQVVLLIDGARAVRLWGDVPDVDLTRFVRHLAMSMRPEYWEMQSMVASGRELREIGEALTDANALVSRVVDLCNISFGPGQLAATASQLTEQIEYSDSRPPVLLLVSSAEGFNDRASGLPESLAEARGRGWLTRTIMVGPDVLREGAMRPDVHVVPANVEADAMALARTLYREAAPSYKLLVRLEKNRLEADGLERQFVVKVGAGDHGGVTSPMTFSIRPDGWPGWVIVLVIGGIVVLILLILTLVYSIVWAMDDGKTDSPAMGSGKTYHDGNASKPGISKTESKKSSSVTIPPAASIPQPASTPDGLKKGDGASSERTPRPLSRAPISVVSSPAPKKR